MHFQLLPLLLVLLLTACDGNTQKDELTLADPNSGSETDGDIGGGDNGGGDNGGGDNGGVTEPEEFCVEKFSPAKNATVANSSANFIFYELFPNTHVFNVSNGQSTELSPSNFSDAIPYQLVSGSDLSSWRQQNSGFWLDQDQLLFANTLTGELEQVSNTDLSEDTICKATQVNPSLTQVAELHVRLDSKSLNNNCGSYFKVDLSLSASDEPTPLPSYDSHAGIKIFNAAGTWLGSLQRSQKSEAEAVPVLSFLRTDMCSENAINLVDFINSNDTWSAQQYDDGSLLLRIGMKVYYLSLTETVDFVLQQNSFTLPEPVITLASFEDDDLLAIRGDYLYFTNLASASLFTYKISTSELSNAQSIFSALELPVNQLTAFKKRVIDDQSLWLEVMYSKEVDSLNDAGEVVLDGDNNPIKVTEYWHRFKRWDLISQAWDEPVQLDYQARSQASETLWHVIDGKAYVKVNSANSLFLKDKLEEDPVADYLLQENTSPIATEKIWHFLQIDAPYARGDNAVLSVDYSDAEGAISLELFKENSTSIDFTGFNAKALTISHGVLQGDYLTINYSACTTDCSDGNLTYSADALDISDGTLRTLDSEIIQLEAPNPAP